MKTVLSIILLALVAGVARADWKDLKAGMDQNAAAAAVGMPLMQNRGRGGAQVWTYDSQGFIQFQSGRVTYWEKSKPAASKALIATQRASVAAPSVVTTKVLPGRKVALKD